MLQFTVRYSVRYFIQTLLGIAVRLNINGWSHNLNCIKLIQVSDFCLSLKKEFTTLSYHDSIMSILYVTMQKIKLFIIKLPFFESLNFSNFGIILSDYLPNLKLDKDSIIIDCGANIGDFTSVVARSGSRVVSVEPHGECFSILRKRFATNKILL